VLAVNDTTIFDALPIFKAVVCLLQGAGVNEQVVDAVNAVFIRSITNKLLNRAGFKGGVRSAVIDYLS